MIADDHMRSVHGETHVQCEGCDRWLPADDVELVGDSCLCAQCDDRGVWADECPPPMPDEGEYV